MNRLIRKAINGWIRWQERRRLYRAIPSIQVIAQERAYYRTHHRKGARMCDRRAFEEMCKALRGAG